MRPLATPKWYQGASPSRQFARPPDGRLSTRRVRGFWPTAREEALLLAALSDPPHLHAALGRWGTPESLACLSYSSLTLLPLLYRNLGRHGVRSDLRDRLKGVYRWSWHKNQILLHALSGALAVLREAHVDALLMKGVPLALGAYADVGARVMGDADVAVRRDDLGRALRALSSAGWAPERTVTPELLECLGGVNVRNDRGVTLDLHWHVLPDSYDSRHVDGLLQSAALMEVGQQRALCLNPADHLLEVICHGLSWAANAPIHWVADAVTLLRADRARLDWDRLVEQAALHGRGLTVRTGLQYLATRFDAPVSASALASLSRLPVGVPERMGFWFAQRSGGTWPWGRAPLVAASYLRASRAHGRRPGPLGLIRFASTRADCSQTEWLRRAAVDLCLHLRPIVSGRSGQSPDPREARG